MQGQREKREKILPVKELKAGSCLLCYLLEKVSIVTQGQETAQSAISSDGL